MVEHFGKSLGKSREMVENLHLFYDVFNGVVNDLARENGDEILVEVECGTFLTKKHGSKWCKPGIIFHDVLKLLLCFVFLVFLFFLGVIGDVGVLTRFF